MNYAFLSTLIPNELTEYYNSKSKKNMQEAANALQWHIYNGLCENLNDKIQMFNVLPVGSYPQYFDDAFIKKSTFGDGNLNIGHCNVKLIRKYVIPGKIYSQLKKWCKNTEGEKTIIVYTISSQFLTAVKKLKKQFPNVKICAVVADLPDMSNLSGNQGLLHRLFIKKRSDNAYSMLNNVDAFVLLTEHMAKYMGIDQPYIVMEGISTNTLSVFCDDKKSDDIKTVFYGGLLHEKFGIMNLVEAFHRIEDEDYRLVICGIGDSEQKIKDFSNLDKRIQFLGQLPRDKVLSLQKQSTVLVNPRQNNEEFTKYSFPSKNLEYLSSGIPFIAYKLDGIPNEYDEYINYPKNDHIDSLKEKIIEICELSSEQRMIMGKRAQKFVMENKNEIEQTKRIVDLLDKI